MAFALAAATSVGFGQTTTLRIGDPAPALHVMAWVKGEPVTRLEPGRVYVVEFWATWCAPCNREMPKLSALQRKYERHLTVIGVDARESEGAEGSVDYVKAFVEKKGDLMAYTVAMDDPVSHPVFDAWMTAGGSYGIPTTFVIDTAGKVVWMGSPSSKAELEFNKAVEQALDGTSDLIAARAAQEEVSRKTAKRLKNAALLAPMWDAQRNHDYALIVAEADKVIVKEPTYAPELFRTRLAALIHFDEERALAETQRKAGDPTYEKALGAHSQLEYWGSIGVLIAGEDGLSKNCYLLAVNYLEKRTATEPQSYSSWVSLALAQYRLGNRMLAIAAQEKAIVIAKQDKSREYRIQQLEETLASYRQGKMANDR